jgi:ferrous iron transport protein A
MAISDNKNLRTLRDIPVGQTAIVKRIHGAGQLKRHIMDMGITKGSEVLVRKLAPLGDPIEITIRGYQLSLRKSECEIIEVE